mmetsp:Transcript_16480/g.33553  ORF Transcript_16480/g.33553 Transcript_16480/m.33553 type:complete len:225 (+) Transcript_16480:1337-2011(+)
MLPLQQPLKTPPDNFLHRLHTLIPQHALLALSPHLLLHALGGKEKIANRRVGRPHRKQSDRNADTVRTRKHSVDDLVIASIPPHDGECVECLQIFFLFNQLEGMGLRYRPCFFPLNVVLPKKRSDDAVHHLLCHFLSTGGVDDQPDPLLLHPPTTMGSPTARPGVLSRPLQPSRRVTKRQIVKRWRLGSVFVFPAQRGQSTPQGEEQKKHPCSCRHQRENQEDR